MTEWTQEAEQNKEIKQDIVVVARISEKSANWLLCATCKWYRQVGSVVWYLLLSLFKFSCFFFPPPLFFSIQRCIMIIPLKNVLFSAIYEPREGWWIYALICALLKLSLHYSYSALERNLENGKHKSQAFLPWSCSKWKQCCLPFSSATPDLEVCSSRNIFLQECVKALEYSVTGNKTMVITGSEALQICVQVPSLPVPSCVL